MPDYDPTYATEFRRYGERGEAGENRNTVIGKLGEAAQLLKATSDTQNRIAAERLNDPGIRQPLAALLLAVSDDWAAGAELRQVFAGYNDPYGKAERAAVAVARVILGEPPPEKTAVPPVEELFADLPENHLGNPQ